MAIIKLADLGDPRLALFSAFTDAQLMRGEFMHVWRKAVRAGYVDAEGKGAQPASSASRAVSEGQGWGDVAPYGVFVAESQKVIDRAIAAGIQPLALLVEQRWVAHEQQVIDFVQRAYPHVPIYIASTPLYQQLTGYKVTRGAMAAFARPQPSTPEQVMANARQLLVVEDVCNFTNMGSIFRAAAALGTDGVLVTPGCHDPLYRRCVRVSMGAVLQVPWARIGFERAWADEGIRLLHEHGFAVVAMALSDDAVEFDGRQLAEHDRVALVLGTEGEGLQQQTVAACDKVMRISMAHEVDSLNVASAATIALWEMRRWRQALDDESA